MLFTTLAAATGLLLPPAKLSARYRNWHYFNGSYDGFVIPPTAGDFAHETLVDCPLAFEAESDDFGGLHGRYRMLYTFYNSQDCGYSTALAASDDLLSWRFDGGVALDRSQVPGRYNYGGVTMGGVLYQSNEVQGSRRLQRVGNGTGRFFGLYGAYDSRAGYEEGSGAQGAAWSLDGVHWHHVSDTVPAIGKRGEASWEKGRIYEPFLYNMQNHTVYNFYNAMGKNTYGRDAEEIGLARLPLGGLPGIDFAKQESAWQRFPGSPIIQSGANGTADSAMASDPKVFWDAQQQVYVMLYFGMGDSTDGHANIMVAFSTDLLRWAKDPEPLYRAGGHPAGIDATHAHKVSLIYKDGVGHLFYTAVGPRGRGIALLTSERMPSSR